MPATGLKVAVVGSGIAGLSTAWLLSQGHHVTLYETEPRAGGHSNTIEVPAGGTRVPVDIGFIVFNETTYPNLTALLAHLGVVTKPSDMSFAVSLDDGQTEYAGTGLSGLFAQRANLFRRRFWSMFFDIRRFYRDAPSLVQRCPVSTSLGTFLDQHGYSAAFCQDHLLPMAAAIWSAPASRVQDYPAAHFIRFCDNHGLLKLTNRPVWRTVDGGSREYVQRMLQAIDSHKFGHAAAALRREQDAVAVRDVQGQVRRYDHVVLACHADQSLALLDDPTERETALLGAFHYTKNRAVVHSDERLMPRRKSVWASWNYLGQRDRPETLQVTYWMNRLQGLQQMPPLFVTLNPSIEPGADTVVHEEIYQHPVFNASAMQAQTDLWSLQGRRKTWFCGAYFGAGFHEDGLQAGLAVAEQLGGVRRPWSVADSSSRIHVTPVSVLRNAA